MENLDRVLSAIFGRPPVFITDGEWLISWLRDEGHTAITFDQAQAVDPSDLPAVVTCATTLDALPVRGFFEERLGGSAMLFLPFTAFETSQQAIHYGFQLLSELDIKSHVDGVVALLRLFESDATSIQISSAAASATLDLSSNIRILNAKTDVDLAPGEWASVSSYLELTLLPRVNQHLLGFSLDGEIRVEACAVAHHRYFPQVAGPLARQAWNLIQETRLHDGFPMLIRVEDSHLVSVTSATGMEILPLLLDCVDPSEGATVLEVAFASGQLPVSSIDWRYNSQFNEAAGGIHVAIGTGLRGAHIDFICPDAQITSR